MLFFYEMISLKYFLKHATFAISVCSLQIVFAEEKSETSSSQSKKGGYLRIKGGYPFEEFSDLNIVSQRHLLPPLHIDLGILVNDAAKNFLFQISYASPTSIHLPQVGMDIQSGFSGPSGLDAAFKLGTRIKVPSSQQPLTGDSITDISLPIELHSANAGIMLGKMNKPWWNLWGSLEAWKFFDTTIAKIDGIAFKKGQKAAYIASVNADVSLNRMATLHGAYSVVALGRSVIFSSDYLEAVKSEVIQNIVAGATLHLGVLDLSLNYSYIPNVDDSLAMYSHGPFPYQPFLLAHGTLFGEMKWNF